MQQTVTLGIRDASPKDIERGDSTPASSNRVQEKFQEHDLPWEEQRQVIRRIDLRVTIMLGFINCMSIVDRANLANAAVAGMNEELELTIGRRYSIVALIFFIPYLIFEFVSTIVARKTGSRRLLMTICILWGLVMIGTGFVKSWKQLAGLRAALGLFEAAFFPVVVHLLSTWYKRDEVQKRYALFFLITISVASFSGVMAYGFTQMQGVGGLSGWRWTFIMEGILTLLVGGLASWFVVDFPDKARESFKFLTDRQINWVIHRLQEDRGDVDAEAFAWSKFLQGGLHFPIWFYAIIFCCSSTVVHTISFFLPIILNGQMGFDRGVSLCLTAPPYLFGAVAMFVAGWVGDKYRVRAPVLLVNSLVSIVGLVLLGWTKPSGVRYFSLFLVNGGVLANIPTVMSYQANNICGQWMRAFGSATLVIGGGLGGLLGALVFGDVKSAASTAGIWGCIVTNAVVVLIVLGLTLFFMHQNHLAKQGHKLIHNQEGFLYSL